MSKVIDLLFGKEKYVFTTTLDTPIKVATLYGEFTLTYQTVHLCRTKFGIKWSRKRIHKGWVFLSTPSEYVTVLENIKNRWFDKSSVFDAITELLKISSNISHINQEMHC